MEQDDILNKINGAKEQFYNQNQKNSFFKKQQKFDCALSIMSNLNETEVFSNIFVVRDDIIVFNYPVFKTIAHPDLYLRMTDYVFAITNNLNNTYGKFKVYIISTGVTISAIERYKDFVRVLSNKGLEIGAGLLTKMVHVQIYNPPSFVDHALKVIIPIVDESLWNKIIIVNDSK